MISNDRKRSALEKLLQSQEFANSKTGRELLCYLVKEAIKGASPKETTIAGDVFGRKNFNPANDSIVRSNIHNVRKKLESYYLKEGLEDPVHILVHRGQYRVDFVEAEKCQPPPKRAQRSHLQSNAITYSLVILFLFLMASMAYFYLKYNALHQKVSPIAKNDPVWSSFLQSDKPTLIVFGDYYLILEYRKDLKKIQEIRDYNVDSDEDLKNYRTLTNNPDAYTPHFNMLPHHTEQNLFDLLPVFASIRKRVKHTVSSRLTWKEIKENNIIYTGKIKNLRLLKQLTSTLWIKYQTNSQFINIVDDKGDTLNTFFRYRAIESLSPDEFQTKNYYNTLIETIEKFPDYIFGKISLSEYYLNTNKYEKISDVLDNKFEITQHFPTETNVFHVSAVRGFYYVTGRYFANIGKIERAYKSYFLLEDIDANHKTTEILGQEIDRKSVV